MKHSVSIITFLFTMISGMGAWPIECLGLLAVINGNILSLLPTFNWFYNLGIILL